MGKGRFTMGETTHTLSMVKILSPYSQRKGAIFMNLEVINGVEQIQILDPVDDGITKAST